MKDQLIRDIQDNLAGILSVEQLHEVRRVLTHHLHGVEVHASFRSEPSEVDDLLEVFISAKRVEGCSKKTLNYYDSTIRHLLESVSRPVREMSTDDLRQYLARYQNDRGVSRVTIDNVRRIFSSFFGWLEDEDYVLKSPVRRIRRIKTDKPVKETISDEGLELLRDSCVEIRDLAMIDLLASTGIRVGELVQLNREDIDFHERECVVVGKGGSERVVYFDARTKIHLQNYLGQRMDRNKALFVALSRPHERLHIGGVEIRIRQIGAKAKIKTHPHLFRRTLATRAIDKGMPIEQVQKLLGHVRIDTTMHYAMVDQLNVKNSHRKYIG